MMSLTRQSCILHTGKALLDERRPFFGDGIYTPHMVLSIRSLVPSKSSSARKFYFIAFYSQKYPPLAKPGLRLFLASGVVTCSGAAYTRCDEERFSS